MNEYKYTTPIAPKTLEEIIHSYENQLIEKTKILSFTKDGTPQITYCPENTTE